VILPGRSGLEILKDLASYPTPVIVMSRKGDIKMAVNAVKGGAVDFIQKPFRREDVMSKLANIKPEMPHRKIKALSFDFPEKKPLSFREREVVRLLVAGLTAKQSGQTLGLSHRTVEDHLARIKQKLGISTTAELVKAVLAKPD